MAVINHITAIKKLSLYVVVVVIIILMYLIICIYFVFSINLSGESNAQHGGL